MSSIRRLDWAGKIFRNLGVYDLLKTCKKTGYGQFGVQYRHNLLNSASIYLVFYTVQQLK
jgi:hypothetical protein